MPKRANDFIHTNEEYVKLRDRRPPGVDGTPRETPQRQAPGGRGYARPELDDWTTEEIRALAQQLKIPYVDMLERSELIDAIQANNATRRR